MSIGWAIIFSMVLWILYKTGVLASRRFWKRAGIVSGSVVLMCVLFGVWWYETHKTPDVLYGCITSPGSTECVPATATKAPDGGKH